MFSFSTIYATHKFSLLFIPIIFFCLLKVVIYYTIYRPLKYKDDGRDVVSGVDFITIHGTFPAINAWVSYQLYYCLELCFTTVCQSPYLQNLNIDFCEEYGKEYIQQSYLKLTYFYKYLLTPSFIFFVLMFVEASINITYYRDCVFAFTMFAIYFGMLWLNWTYRFHKALLENDNDDDQDEVEGGSTLSMLIINSFKRRHILLGKSYDGLQFKDDADEICGGLIWFCILLFFWITMTITIDWSSVFYRKAIIYKRRIN